MEFRIEENAAIGQDFTVSGIHPMPGARPLIVMTEESATQLCLELAYQLKLFREAKFRRDLQNVANEVRAEVGLPPLDPPDSITGFQKR